MAGLRQFLKECLHDPVEGAALVCKAEEAVPGKAQVSKKRSAGGEGPALTAPQRRGLESHIRSFLIAD